jgi:hypothetical protein
LKAWAFQKLPYRWMRHGALQILGGAYDPEKQLSHLRFARLKFFHGSTCAEFFVRRATVGGKVHCISVVYLGTSR